MKERNRPQQSHPKLQPQSNAINKTRKTNNKAIKFLLILTTMYVYAFGYVNEPIHAFDHKHTQWNNELKKYVKEGNVDYSTWKKNQSGLDAYLQILSAVDEKEYSSFNNSEKLSFLINAYNAFTIRLILDHYPLKSIKELGGLFSGPWKLEFFSLLGSKKNLDWIEHEKLRKDFQEPRIHFAINCASKGCPPLFEQSFQAPKLEEQLIYVSKRFLTDRNYNRYDSSQKILYLSKIFQWFGGDFTRKSGSLISFYNSNSGLSPVPANAEIRYLDYDWNLNQTK
ncbi:DUF547 domain-containing protein [Leptospira kmetyi]|uniref:DUF547 domain-containing protein n=1 Tax=Leptospira kmetyi TaxID=408139 RepID=UPI000288535E|nr:DUF547 domain-containing protein [Leptospira kmetyi]EQA55756.1 PF04784 family protein [Leptospira kmetyi serovar Malaysia str. Bejo-Iso9]